MGPNFVWEVSKAFAEKVSFKLSLEGQVELSLMKRRELGWGWGWGEALYSEGTGCGPESVRG